MTFEQLTHRFDKKKYTNSGL